MNRFTRWVLLLAVSAPALAAPTFHAWAPTPPMGWNSWDSFATTITEQQTQQQADYMAAHLKAHGWQYIIVDIQWYEPGAKSHDYRRDAVLTMDEYARLTPALNRFPSAANGAGFKPLADYVHGLGLKFGIHLLRGIPRQAVDHNLPIFGTTLHAQDIADRNSICAWNPDMYGVDMTKPGAQEYYNSVVALIASWGVDYLKVDDISRPYQQAEIEAIRHAIDRTGRAIVLSLSPGETPLQSGEHVQQHANLWRISDDFWDQWLSLREQFARLENWNRFRVPGAWPDADMLPLGTLVLGQRSTRFTPDEQRTLMTLWAIARSPLMYGGDMIKTDAATLALLTNDEVLAVNQRSVNNRPLFNRDDLIAWIADVPNSTDKYLAVFNTRDRVRLTASNARYTSTVVTRDPASAAKIDVDLKGGKKLFLIADPTEDGVLGDHALWRAPVFVMNEGREQSLSELQWTHAESLWDDTAVKQENGHAIGIAAHAMAVTEYAVPAGAQRFRATASVEPGNDNAKEGGSVRFMVVVGTADNETTTAGVPISIKLADLGFKGRVRIRDLWTHKDVVVTGKEFAPEIFFHGAGLYRISTQ